MLVLFLFVFICFTSSSNVYLYPTGAPVRHCGDMTPGHNVEPLDDLPPFKIIVEPADSSNLIVRIQADEDVHFKGFLIEARSNLNNLEAIGKWQTSERHTKLLDCFNITNSAVTHYFRDDDKESNKFRSDDGPRFTQLNFKWSHSNLDTLNQVYFVATVVKRFKQIYLNVTTSVNPKHLLTAKNDLKYLIGQLKELFKINLQVEHVHFTFIFLVILTIFISLLLLHILSKKNRKYVLLNDNDKLIENN